MNTKLQALADVWVTFVHEGAGWKNTLGYYTYPLNNPPTSVNDIDSLFVIFPNVSFSGSGGQMATGDKVHLGQFPADTGIGWFLIPNSWDAGSQTILDKNQVKVSVHEFNDYTGVDYRQHTILLNDVNRELLLLGFEDTTRPAGDNDFNDAIFYVTANPYSAIITDELLEVTEATDTDGDGIFDHEDDFPEDPQKAYITYKPGSNKWGTLAFEDLWPNQGDYDFNDLVLDYRFELHLSASRKIQEVLTTLKLKAIGGAFHNGFGIEFPISPASVESVSGGHYTEGYTQRAANGTELNQANAVIIAFENAYHLMAPPSGGLVNAERDGQYVTPVTQTLIIDLVDDQISEGTLSFAPYNPFIIVNRERGREIHLPNKAGTSLANQALYNIGDDATNNGVPYTTNANLPWALHLGSGFDYPYENEDITETHLHFGAWAQSGGGQYTDWFRNKSGYRNANNIYQP